MPRFARSVAFVLLSLVVSVPAFAQGAVGGGWTGYTYIPAGTKQFTFDHLLIFDRDRSSPTDSDISRTTRQFAWNGGLGFQYFVVQNVGVGVNAGYLVDSRLDRTETPDDTVEVKTNDSGFIGFVTADYYVRLGRSMFFRPGIGLGYFTGTRDTPVAGSDSLTASTAVSGFAGRLDLGGVFYPSRSLSLRASVSLVTRVGSLRPDEDDPNALRDENFSALDAAFGLGVGYAF